MDSNAKVLKEILKRLDKLEKAVFASERKKPVKRASAGDHQGASGGVRLLIETGYFSKKHTAGEVWEALQQREYHYKREVVQVALLRMSKVGGPLVAMTEKGVKVYVNRK